MIDLSEATIEIINALFSIEERREAVRGPVDLAIALVGFTLLVAWRASALLVVVWCVVANLAGAFLL